MTDLPTNDELVRRAMAGDIPAFGTLYDRTVRLVRAVAADVGPDGAEDVTHDTFLRAYRTLYTLRAPERFGPWLVGIARRVVLERRRARRFDPLPDQMPAPAALSADDVEDTQELLRLVAELPEEERLAVRFYFLNEAQHRRNGTASGPLTIGHVRCPQSRKSPTCAMAGEMRG